MNYRSINYFLVSILVIVLYFTIPFYNNWLYLKVLNNSFLEEAGDLDEGNRNMKRFGYSYSVFSDVQKLLNNDKSVLMLLPPNDYVKEKKVGDLVIPEPAVFYYFTGLKSVTANSQEAKRANWALLAIGPSNVIVKQMEYVTSPDSLIKAYKKYKK